MFAVDSDHIWLISVKITLIPFKFFNRSKTCWILRWNAYSVVRQLDFSQITSIPINFRVISIQIIERSTHQPESSGRSRALAQCQRHLGCRSAWLVSVLASGARLSWSLCEFPWPARRDNRYRRASNSHSCSWRIGGMWRVQHQSHHNIPTSETTWTYPTLAFSISPAKKWDSASCICLGRNCPWETSDSWSRRIFSTLPTGSYRSSGPAKITITF